MNLEKISENELEKLVGNFNESFQKLKSEIGKVIIGQEEVVNHLLTGLFCKGHCLLVGVPGLAKTLMISTLSQVLDPTFNRIQFTPDLMPSDITGTDIIEELPDGKKQFRFIKGPVFANIILADEINRTPPKTQSALLEAMQEHKVTAGGHTNELDEPFFVLATQNPIEQEGTYPLPEAQLDRFMFNIYINYPTFEEEKQIVTKTTGADISQVNSVFSKEDILTFQQLIRHIPLSDVIVDFAVKLSAYSRPENAHAPEFVKKWVNWGAGPRASQFLILAAKANALLKGRLTPVFEDVKSVVLPIFRHRIILNFSAEAEGISVEKVIEQLMEEVNKNLI